MTATDITPVQRAASNYLGAGWQPLPLLPRTKRPFAGNWTERTLSAADLLCDFAPTHNIGLKCGTPSDGLIDIDIDDPIALRSFAD